MAVMAVERTLTTVEAFDNLIRRADQILELVAGEIIEAPSNLFVSAIAARILIALGIFLKGKNWGHLTGEAGLYTVAEDRYAPDAACISKARAGA